jgi:hypothetical protein
MAPKANSAEQSSIPLADYFFIAGIETSQVYDERTQPSAISPVALGPTIEEDASSEAEATNRPVSTVSSDGNLTIKPENRWSRQSNEARKSVGSIIGGSEAKFTVSNRSSATIRAIPTLQVGGSGLTDADFDQALQKFACERDTFLEDLQFTTGTMAQAKASRPRPKTQRIVNEDRNDVAGNLKSSVGTLRRRISTMSSMKRQPSVLNRQSLNSPLLSFKYGTYTDPFFSSVC